MAANVLVAKYIEDSFPFQDERAQTLSPFGQRRLQRCLDAVISREPPARRVPRGSLMPGGRRPSARTDLGPSASGSVVVSRASPWRSSVRGEPEGGASSPGNRTVKLCPHTRGPAASREGSARDEAGEIRPPTPAAPRRSRGAGDDRARLRGYHSGRWRGLARQSLGVAWTGLGERGDRVAAREHPNALPRRGLVRSRSQPR
jgi:hypothetical protein